MQDFKIGVDFKSGSTYTTLGDFLITSETLENVTLGSTV